jgi:tetratricopeptide (TPR) repeat protein
VNKFVEEAWDFFEDGDLDSSLARLQAALDLEPDNVEALEGLVWTYLYMYRFDECAAVLEDALGLDPDRVDCLVAAAFLYQATEEYESAIAMAQDALDMAGSFYVFEYDPDVTDEDVRYSLILSLAGTGDFRGALDEAKVLDPTIDIDPDDRGTWGAHNTFEEAMIALIEDLRQDVLA